MRRDQLKYLRNKGETPAQTLARVHHEAFLVEQFGLPGSGVAYSNFLRMVNIGLVQPVAVPRRKNQFQVIVEAAERFGRMDNQERAAAKDWSADKWRQKLEESPPLPELVAGSAPETIVLPGHGIPEVRWGHQPIEDVAHLVQEALQALPHPQEPHAPISEVPATLQGYMRDAYKQALERAGMYCKALGDVVGDELTAVTEDSSEVVRTRRLAAIRRDVAQAIRDGWSREELASKMQGHTQDYVRDWERVAVTELQGAYNDAAVLTAVRLYGTGAQVARIPETTACAQCLRLFLENGVPKVFKVIDLIKNGSNVGLRPLQWKPTIWPIHPRCRCGCIPVPKGYSVDRSGALAKDTAAP